MPHSVRRDEADVFARSLRDELEREFPGEVFRTYPDFDGSNQMLLVAPKAAEPAMPGRTVAFERRVRTIINRLLTHETWRSAGDH